MPLARAFAFVFGRRSVWVPAGVAVAVLLTWAFYPARTTEAGEAQGAASTSVQESGPLKDGVFEAYSGWLATSHQRAANEAHGSALPDQF